MIPPRTDATKRSWVRKVDGDMHVVGPDKQPEKRWYPADLDELLWVVTQRMNQTPPPSTAQAHACASHWAMSEAAVTPGTMIETATPVHEGDGDQSAPRLNHVLYDVIPECMTQQAKDAFIRQDVRTFDPTIAPAFWPDPMKYYLFHVESGMRIYELYSFIDSEADGNDARSLAAWIARNRGPDSLADYSGPWALETMGGAGGQTIAGVASTATHGGDVMAAAISHSVVAIHLIAPDGQEYWVETLSALPSSSFLPLVDEDLLHKKYAAGDPSKPGGAFRQNKIIVQRSNDLMQAAVVACGRMGIIYSMVLRVIRPYALEEKIDRSQYWGDVKKWIANAADPQRIALMAHRFVRVDIDVYPKPVFDWSTVAWTFGAGLFGSLPLAMVGLYAGLKGDQYRCWIYTRNVLPLAASAFGTPPEFYGRKERAGANQGAMAELENQDDPDGNFRDPCSSSNWLHQFLQDMKNELADIRNDALIAVGALELLIDAAVFFGNLPLATFFRTKQAIAFQVAVFAQAWIEIFTVIQALLPTTMAFGDFIASVLNTFASMHAASLIQLLYWYGANSQHKQLVRPAISYAVMDRHSYVNKGCLAPGDSIEFFMDATTLDLVSFIDYVLDQVRALADDGTGFGGYISLRFMYSSPEYLAMQRWPATCSIEIAGLSRVDGTDPLMQRMEEESRVRNIVLHWGQRNNRVQADIEKVFLPTIGGPLNLWRRALSYFSANGRLNDFSSTYSRLKGLEITEPKLYALSGTLTEGCQNDQTTIHYDALDNPPETFVSLTQLRADGTVVNLLPGGHASSGDIAIAFGRGRSQIRLRAVRELNGNKYTCPPRTLDLQGFATGDEWHFEFLAEKRMVGSVLRWYAEVNLFSQYISDNLRVASVRLVAAPADFWIVRNAELGVDVPINPVLQTAALPSFPLMNRNWTFFSQSPAAGAAPTIDIYFVMQ